MLRIAFSKNVVILIALLGAATLLLPAQERIEIDAQGAATPFPHYWEQMFGSGRAILSLRETHRDDLRAVRKFTQGIHSDG